MQNILERMTTKLTTVHPHPQKNPYLRLQGGNDLITANKSHGRRTKSVYTTSLDFVVIQ